MFKFLTTMLSLFPDVLSEIAIYLPIAEIPNLCLLNKNSCNLLRNCNPFWKKRAFGDFKLIDECKSVQDWLHFYRFQGSLWVFGNNHFHQLGINYQTDKPVKIPNIIPIKVQTGYDCSGAIDINYKLWGAGRNGCWNKLGLQGEHIASFTPIVDFQVKDVSFGADHTVLVDMNDRVWGCGSNQFGTLGLGSVRDVDKFTFIFPNKVLKATAEYMYTVILDYDHNIWVMGQNHATTLGLGHNSTVYIPTMLPNFKVKDFTIGSFSIMFLDFENNVWSCGSAMSDLYTNNPIPAIVPNIKAKQISIQTTSAMFIDLEDRVWVIGENDNGQIGLGKVKHVNDLTLIPNISARQISGDYFCSAIIDKDYNVWMTGRVAGYKKSRTFTRLPNMKASQLSVYNAHTVLIRYSF